MLSGTNFRNQKQTLLGEFFHQRLPEHLDLKPVNKEVVEELDKRNKQIAILNAVNTRLAEELISAHEKLGVSSEKVAEELENLNEISLAYHFQTQQLEYLDTLFTAYDDALLKHKKMIGRLYSELTAIEKKSEMLVKDNIYLTDELENKTKKILQIYSNGFPEENLANIYIRLQKEDMDQKIQYYREQNQYLLRNCKELQIKLAESQKHNSMSQEQTNKYFNNYKKQTEQMKDLLIRSEELEKIKEVLESRFNQLTEENIKLETNNSQLQTKLSRYQNENRLIKIQLNNIKKTEKENIQKNSDQISQLKNLNQGFSHRERQHFSKLCQVEKQLEVTVDNLNKTKRETEQVKRDFEQALKMLETYEIKINNYVKKEQILENSSKGNREKVENALLERDKANLKKQELEKYIESLGSKHRQEVANITESYEKIIRSQAEKLKSAEEQFDEQETNHKQTQTTLKNQIDKLKRQLNQLKEENQKYMKNLKSTNSEDLANRIKDYQERNQSLKRLIQERENTHKEQSEYIIETKTKLERQNQELSRQLDKERISKGELTNQIASLKSKLSIAVKERDSIVQQAKMEIKRAEGRVQTLQGEYNGRVMEMEDKIAEAAKRESEALKRQRTAREKAIKMLEGYDEAEEKLKYQYESRIKELENENEKMRDKLAVAMKKR